MDGNKIIEKMRKDGYPYKIVGNGGYKALFPEYNRFPAEITWQSTDTQAESAVTAWKK